MDGSATVSERQDDGSYRVEIEGKPLSGAVVWGTHQFWARKLGMYEDRVAFKAQLEAVYHNRIDVEEGGCQFWLYPEDVATTVVTILKRLREHRQKQEPV